MENAGKLIEDEELREQIKGAGIGTSATRGGMEQEKAETLVTYQAKGYGLKNVNDRIRLLYGESYGIQIYSAPGEGTTVIMRFPKEIRNYEE